MKIFTKNDLEAGMIAVFRNGRVHVVRSTDVWVNSQGVKCGNFINDYEDALRNKFDGEKDIVSVGSETGNTLYREPTKVYVRVDVPIEHIELKFIIDDGIPVLQAKPTHLYRVYDECEEDGVPYFYSFPYKIIKETPCGKWILLSQHPVKKRFVLNTSVKRFAHETIEAAIEDYVRRKTAQVRILHSQIRYYERCLKKIEEEKSYLTSRLYQV